MLYRQAGNENWTWQTAPNFSVGFVWDYTEGGSFTFDAFQVILEDAVTNVDVTNLAAREAYCEALEFNIGDEFEAGKYRVEIIGFAKMISDNTKIPIIYDKEDDTDSFTLSNLKLLKALKINYNLRKINSKNLRKYL